MKANIHPEYKELEVNCSCGNTFTTKSTLESKSLHVEVCDKCHPFYTGKQKIVDTAGRIDKFNKRFSAKPKTEAAPAAAKAKVAAKPKASAAKVATATAKTGSATSTTAKDTKKPKQEDADKADTTDKE